MQQKGVTDNKSRLLRAKIAALAMPCLLIVACQTQSDLMLSVSMADDDPALVSIQNRSGQSLDHTSDLLALSLLKIPTGDFYLVVMDPNNRRIRQCGVRDGPFPQRLMLRDGEISTYKISGLSSSYCLRPKAKYLLRVEYRQTDPRGAQKVILSSQQVGFLASPSFDGSAHLRYE
jgi:hypothetical protein